MHEHAASRRRTIVPPEGIPLEFTIARAGDRAAAFLYDGIIQFAAMLLVIFAAFLGGAEAAEPIIILLFFFIRTFYFIWFEARWQGRTPGKKRIGIRVMDARGGPLQTDAIIARNLMREIEFWIPLMFLFGAEYFWPEAAGWARLLFVGWAFTLTGMPMFNRDRLRAGDMIAGTIVVMAPKAMLLPDLGGQVLAGRATKTAVPRPEYPFTDAQLDVYGIYELQVLETLLRRRDAGRIEALKAVAKQIKKKIDWTGDKVRAERFLREFYAALRGRLERRMLLGKRKRDKHS